MPSARSATFSSPDSPSLTAARSLPSATITSTRFPSRRRSDYKGPSHPNWNPPSCRVSPNKSIIVRQRPATSAPSSAQPPPPWPAAHVVGLSISSAEPTILSILFVFIHPRSRQPDRLTIASELDSRVPLWSDCSTLSKETRPGMVSRRLALNWYLNFQLRALPQEDRLS